jgi:hypothetical protein
MSWRIRFLGAVVVRAALTYPCIDFRELELPEASDAVSW